MVEEERKYQVNAPLAVAGIAEHLPRAYRLVPRPPVQMRATYFDTADLRLARAGVSLRYRTGDPDAPWTVKLPTDTARVRQEIGRPASPQRPASTIPADLVTLVTVYSRGASLAPVVTIRSKRERWDVRGRDDEVIAEIDDDAVAIYEDKRIIARFREIEVERKAGTRKALRRIGRELVTAGADESGFVPKHLRALRALPEHAPAANQPPDLCRARGLETGASTAEAVTEALRVDIARILDHDPLVRLRAPIGPDDTAVHQMRVGVRRLRSTLRLFGTVFATSRKGVAIDEEPGAPAWHTALDRELRWLAGLLGGARDAEVIRARLRGTTTLDPVHPPDAAAVARIEAELAARHEDAYAALDEGLASTRYLALVDRLYAVAEGVDFIGSARRPAAVLLPRAVSRAWHRLADGRHGIDGADDLDATAPDEQWHAIRIRAKRARYAAEAAIGACGAPARHLADALATVTDVLGSHQDACTAAETWLAIAATDPDDQTLAITAGRLAEREYAVAHRLREAYPDAWRAASAERLRSWLP